MVLCGYALAAGSQHGDTGDPESRRTSDESPAGDQTPLLIQAGYTQIPESPHPSRMAPPLDSAVGPASLPEDPGPDLDSRRLFLDANVLPVGE
ncbi:hypothetical protein ACRRTK_016136 [Alexandromys fortis]